MGKNFQFTLQDYQADASRAIVDIFVGQTKGERKETVGRSTIIEEIFSNKKIELSENDILRNVQDIQSSHSDQGLRTSKTLGVAPYQFSVEMETGTGKTYVYTRTIFELNKEYGWNKFIIIVPSVAIREGVYKSLQITTDHFQELYGKKIRFSIYDTKNKSNLTNIKSFANTSNIELLIMNYQAFATTSKESRKIYQKLDATNSEKPIDIIKRARPILIIDEPQRFGEKAEKMLDEFKPLFITRYSATHKQDKEFNKVYRLDAIDAFNHKLVKKINVRGIEVVGNSGTNSYLFLDRIIISKDVYPTAYIEFETKQKQGIKKIVRKINEGDDLFALSDELQQYKGFVVKEINGITNSVTFINGVKIHVGQASGDVDELHVRRIQIRETIQSHLEKERVMFKKSIKVLSLFFIDEVAKYRKYDERGNKINGEYALIFEEEYQNAIKQTQLFDEDYRAYLESFKVDSIHNGYFSIDKKSRYIDSAEKKDQGGSDDVDAYDLIMKDKEKLLDFNSVEPTRFIFSHSALREGWDNPNIFQICTLKHSQSTIGKRQEIGRGLRISVNKDGERMDYEKLNEDYFDINTLTVVASESYDTFAKELQDEMLKALSGRPTRLTVDVLKGIVLKNKDQNKLVFDDTSAMNLIFDLRNKQYLDGEYKVTDKMVEAVNSGEFTVTEEFAPFVDEITQLAMKINDTMNYKAAYNEKEDNVFIRELKPNDNFAKKDFQDLWNKIKVKTVYEVDFDSEELIKNSVQALDSSLVVKKVRVNITEGTQKNILTEDDLKAGLGLKKTDSQTLQTASILGDIRYDLIAEIAKGANVTRKTAAIILQKVNANTFGKFRVNPEDFIREVTRIINEQKATTLINNITYSKTDQSYTDDVFTVNNFKGSLKKNIIEVKKHIYDYLKYDSGPESSFAKDLEVGEIAVYAKLPNGFKIPTPVGNYNPDWAIVFDRKDVKYVYFIAETKGSMSTMQLKKAEELKINYAKKHFEALHDSSIKYGVVSDYENLLTLIQA